MSEQDEKILKDYVIVNYRIALLCQVIPRITDLAPEFLLTFAKLELRFLDTVILPELELLKHRRSL